MSVFEFLVSQKKPTPGQVAKTRLKAVLVHDRLKLNPELLELIKAEVLSAISRRLEVDEAQMQVALSREDGADKLQALVPIRRQKVTFEWDPPTHTPNQDMIMGKVIVKDEDET